MLQRNEIWKRSSLLSMIRRDDYTSSFWFAINRAQSVAFAFVSWNAIWPQLCWIHQEAAVCFAGYWTGRLAEEALENCQRVPQVVSFGWPRLVFPGEMDFFFCLFLSLFLFLSSSSGSLSSPGKYLRGLLSVCIVRRCDRCSPVYAHARSGCVHTHGRILRGNVSPGACVGHRQRFSTLTTDTTAVKMSMCWQCVFMSVCCFSISSLRLSADWKGVRKKESVYWYKR